MASTRETWPDLAGRLVETAGGTRHVLPVRVYFEDTDFSGLVYHATYLKWIERGRSDFLRLKGIHHSELLAGEGAAPAAFVVRRMHLDFLKPARIDDVLEIETRVGEVTKATLELHQIVRKADSELFRASVLVVLVSTAGKPLRLPPGIRSAFGVG
ncbi:MAG: tol-pal system-associated acyl-CoA thioesterase [Hyphomicrobiaceae bacterium]